LEKEFLETVHEHQKIIHKVCRLYRDTKEDQEDLVQEIVYQLGNRFHLSKVNQKSVHGFTGLL